MASRSGHLLLVSATVLLSIIATTAAAAAAAAYTDDWCEQGLVIPFNPLRACRSYLARRTCGPGAAGATAYDAPMPVMKARCCRELAAVVPYCRCRALRMLMDNVPPPAAGEPLPCSWWQGDVEVPRFLVTEAECNLPTIHGAPFCYALGAE